MEEVQSRSKKWLKISAFSLATACYESHTAGGKDGPGPGPGLQAEVYVFQINRGIWLSI